MDGRKEDFITSKSAAKLAVRLPYRAALQTADGRADGRADVGAGGPLNEKFEEGNYRK